MIRRDALRQLYDSVRALTLRLAAPLSAEDQCVQAMPEASPTKWHLAHTSWFFETMVLQPLAPGYRACDERNSFLFNSYYHALGPRQARPQRGMITRPGLREVLDYRAHVDRAMQRLFDACDDATWNSAAALIELGVHHEQQHQELILTDIKYTLSLNPYDAVYLTRDASADGGSVAGSAATELQWIPYPGGEVGIGHSGHGFAYDNEGPRHLARLYPYALANRLVSCGEFLRFIEDGGYRRPEFWLADGWDTVVAQNWGAPLYWQDAGGGQWLVFTLNGWRALDPTEPVCHLSFFEAAAYAQWTGARLPTEFEWEAAVAGLPVAGAFLDPAALHPRAAPAGSGLLQGYGDAWNWTRSSYDPYPGFRALSGALSEYNGKFMVGQLVLRGGSCASPPGHLRASYRNFFPPGARWQFSGIRLARDV